MTSEPAPDARRDDDVFYCPSCGQKHRGDLSAARAGSALRATCPSCKAGLVVEWRENRAVARLAEAAAAAPPPPAPAQRPAPSEPRAAAPDAKSGAGDARRERRPGASRPEARGDERTERKASKGKDEKGKEDTYARGGVEITGEYVAGTRISRYTIEEAVGEGGTGTVYRAFDPTTNRFVALKILRIGQSESMRQRFLREIEVQANLRHPNLMPVFDRGEHDGRPFFTMELLYRPFTLTNIVEMAREGTLSRYATLRPFEDVANIARDVLLPVCDGLHVANVENGVVHRDLKPDNVLLDSRTLRPYVIDFGICHVLERKGKSAGLVVAPTSEDAGIVGTPRFLSPEQARGSVHERTDVWGLGAILRFILSGEPPIAAAAGITRAELRKKVTALGEAVAQARAAGEEKRADLAEEKLARLEDPGLRTLDDVFRDAREGTYVDLPSNAPAALAAIARKASAPKTAERYTSARSMAADLQAWVEGSHTRAQVEEGTTAAAVVQSAGRAVRRHLVTGLFAVGALVVGALIGLGIGRSGAAKASSPDADARDAVAYVRNDLMRLESVGENVSRRTWNMRPRAYAGLHDLLADRVGAAATRLEALRDTEGAEMERKRLRNVMNRLAPHAVEVRAPAAWGDVTVEDVGRGTEPTKHPLGAFPLAPGEYRLALGAEGRVRLPLVVPFEWRTADLDPAREPPIVVSVAFAPTDVPDGSMLVAASSPSVYLRGPPFSDRAPVPTPVAPFLMDRNETTNSEWAAFLGSIADDGERAKRVPSEDFSPDSDRPKHFRVVKGFEDVAVSGVTPDDAAAYCAWRSTRDGAKIRLPSEAEWIVAGSGAQDELLAAGSAGDPTDADYGGAKRAVGKVKARDVSACGIHGMLGNVREIVTEVRTGQSGPPKYLTKGAGIGDEPIEAALRRVRPLASNARERYTGFRCVRELAAK